MNFTVTPLFGTWSFVELILILAGIICLAMLAMPKRAAPMWLKALAVLMGLGLIVYGIVMGFQERAEVWLWPAALPLLLFLAASLVGATAKDRPADERDEHATTEQPTLAGTGTGGAQQLPQQFEQQAFPQQSFPQQQTAAFPGGFSQAQQGWQQTGQQGNLASPAPTQHAQQQVSQPMTMPWDAGQGNAVSGPNGATAFTPVDGARTSASASNDTDSFLAGLAKDADGADAVSHQSGGDGDAQGQPRQPVVEHEQPGFGPGFGQGPAMGQQGQPGLAQPYGEQGHEEPFGQQETAGQSGFAQPIAQQGPLAQPFGQQGQQGFAQQFGQPNQQFGQQSPQVGQQPMNGQQFGQPSQGQPFGQGPAFGQQGQAQPFALPGQPGQPAQPFGQNPAFGQNQPFGQQGQQPFPPAGQPFGQSNPAGQPLDGQPPVTNSSGAPASTHQAPQLSFGDAAPSQSSQPSQPSQPPADDSVGEGVTSEPAHESNDSGATGPGAPQYAPNHSDSEK